ncbi:MAG: high-affinity iron transporter [Actinomycetota bacterium]|nr:high-affinity iron transporter [Actinomycetota bacterium]
MLSNYLIGLREGLEASLVVGILIAYLVRTGNREKVRLVWIGVGLAVALSLAFGAALTFGSAAMSFQAQEAFGGVLSIVAVGFVTWMVFWMKSAARGLKGELHGQLDKALAAGGFALAVVAFVAVVREGLETALFLWAAVKATGQNGIPLTGALLGLATAVVLGWLIYRGALRLNLATFFKWTGAALIVVAAGVLAYGVHDLQEAGLLPGLNTLAWDVSAQIPASSWYGSILKGTVNFSPKTTWLEAVVWLSYLVPVMYLYLRPARSTAVRPTPVPAARV